MDAMHYQNIIDFWFNEIAPHQWFTPDTRLDRLIQSRFHTVHTAAGKGELYAWRDAPAGRLAEIIVLDQFSRNIYRGAPHAYAFDALALVLAQEAIRAATHFGFAPQQKAFLYMPFMHSESPLIHRRALELFNEPGLEKNLAFELQHKAIIDRFGRYPHRNAVLGRASSAEELAFLDLPGSSF